MNAVLNSAATYAVHPIANIFPAMSPAEFDALVDDIREHGQREPVWLHEGKVIDGRHRVQACAELGIEVKSVEYTGDDPLAFIVSLNLHRRHLNESQRAMVAARLATLGRGRPGENAPIGGISQDAAAELLNVSTRAVQRATVVRDEAVPELVRAVEEGRASVSAASHIASLPHSFQRETVERAQAGSTSFATEAKEVHNHRAQGTGENEWYTPAEYVDAAREVMGDIDTDPASSEFAQRTVKAGTFYTIDDDGLAQDWEGRVWMNPPYAQPAIAHFIEKLAASYESGSVTEAIALTHNYTDTQWFHRAAKACDAICFTRGRIGFVNPEGKKAAPTQGQAFFYFGEQTGKFAAVFAKYGFVVEVRHE